MYLPGQYRQDGHPLMETIAYSHNKCGDKRSRLYVTKTNAGWMFHCHNCAGGAYGLSGFMPDAGQTHPAATLKKIKGATVPEPTFLSTYKGLPEDMTRTLPVTAQLWLSKYGITEGECVNYGIGYSPHFDRVVLPIYDTEGEWLYRPVKAWQGRCLRDDDIRPKYISYKPTGEKIMFDSAIHHTADTDPSTGDTLVIVEDILSAIKVGRQCHTIAVLGSYLNEKVIKKAFNKKRVLLWLDDDKHKESQAFSQRLRGFGISAVTLTTNKDPKELRDSEITLMLTI